MIRKDLPITITNGRPEWMDAKSLGTDYINVNGYEVPVDSVTRYTYDLKTRQYRFRVVLQTGQIVEAVGFCYSQDFDVVAFYIRHSCLGDYQTNNLLAFQ